ncbi:tat signal-containing [Desulfonema limicola]|uniref:Tat signal-containing n=1 Tax=Desulfonema limicola TaxID=45656 RepID=A0A975GIR0_9BACT|nr:twin-arginine translocation signal domain-containing protein [Desulfonema limicola]QTA82827.1 tat signal-containing [Desulfonema limicola]
MKNNSCKEVSRRDFLKLAAAGTGAVLLLGNDPFFSQASGSEKHTPHLNPGFRIKEISDNEIELFTRTGSGIILKHKFTDLEADIFREIEKQGSITSIIQAIASKHNISRELSQKKVSALLHEFEDAKLIYYGNKMIVKVSGIKNAG